MLDILKKIIIFENLDESELLKVSHIALEKKYNKGDIIFNEEEEGNELFIIVSGEIEISKNLIGENKKVLAVLKTDNFFGEMSVFDNKKRSANALALTDLHLLVITKEKLAQLLEQEKDIAVKCYKSIFCELCRRIRNLNKNVQDRIMWGFNIG